MTDHFQYFLYDRLQLDLRLTLFTCMWILNMIRSYETVKIKNDRSFLSFSETCGVAV